MTVRRLRRPSRVDDRFDRTLKKITANAVEESLNTIGEAFEAKFGDGSPRRCTECGWSTVAHHPDCPARRVNHG